MMLRVSSLSRTVWRDGSSDSSLFHDSYDNFSKRFVGLLAAPRPLAFSVLTAAIIIPDHGSLRSRTSRTPRPGVSSARLGTRYQWEFQCRRWTRSASSCDYVQLRGQGKVDNGSD